MQYMCPNLSQNLGLADTGSVNAVWTLQAWHMLSFGLSSALKRDTVSMVLATMALFSSVLDACITETMPSLLFVDISLFSPGDKKVLELRLQQEKH